MSTKTDDRIGDLLAAYQELDAEYDRVTDDASATKDEERRVIEQWNRAWDEYATACSEAGICVRPRCGEPRVVRDTLCAKHRRD